MASLYACDDVSTLYEHDSLRNLMISLPSFLVNNVGSTTPLESSGDSRTSKTYHTKRKEPTSNHREPFSACTRGLDCLDLQSPLVGHGVGVAHDGNIKPPKTSIHMIVHLFVGIFWKAKQSYVYWIVGTFRPAVLRYDMFGIVDPDMQNEQLIESEFNGAKKKRNVFIDETSSHYTDTIRVMDIVMTLCVTDWYLEPWFRELVYESVEVVEEKIWLLRHKVEMVCHEKIVKMPCVPKELVGFTPRRRVGFRMELVQGATPICEGLCRLTSLERQEVWNDCRSCKVRVGSNGNLLWEAFVWLVAREDDCGVTKGRKDVCEVFQQRGSGAKRKISRCGRNQMGNEPILALPEGADDFVVYYDARSKDLEACLEKRRSEFDFEAKCHLGKANVDVVPWSEAKNEFEIDVRRSDLGLRKGCWWHKIRYPKQRTRQHKLTNRWLSMKKDIASYGSKYLAYSEEEVEYQGTSGLLWVVEGLTSERCSMFRKKDKLEQSYVGPFENPG
ncbi:hypothetical protein Tco_1522487 [Tanacetum coccineum]